MMDLPRTGSPDDALSQPTRARLFTLLGELGRPAGTVELAEHLGLHPNGVRLHLERLQRDGLLVRESEPQSRGRPRDSWKIAPDAHPGGRAPQAYADLVRWLARATGSGSRGLRGIEATGREIGQELASRQGTTGEDAFQATLTALGFLITALAAKFILKEEVTALRWAGVLLIVIGASLVSYSEKAKEKPAPPPATTVNPIER